MPAKKHKRTKQRVPVTTAVRIRYEDWDQFQTEYAHNISEGGIFIHTSKPFKPGTLFQLEMTVAGEKVLAKAQVIWTKEFPTEENRPSGMGARFVEMDDVSRSTLYHWIDGVISSAKG